MPKRRYSREFKLSAVKLVNEQGYQIVEAAKSLGIDSSNLRNWLGKFADEAGVAPTGEGAMQAELRKLRKDNARLLMERDILKKSGGILREGAVVKFAFIKEHRRLWPVAAICRVLKVSRSGFFAWLKRPASRQNIRRRELIEKIRRAYRENRELYGSPRVHRALLIDGEVVSRNTVAKLMRQEKIRAKNKRKFVPRTTDSRHARPVAANLLDRDFAASAPDRKWVADITYVATEQGWLYVAGILDCFSRKIVGWAMAEHMETSLVSDALRMALTQRRPGELLHHSDRGVQYASDDYQHLLQSHDLIASMSGKGDCWDNAMMESFWSTFKTELVYQCRFATREQAKGAIFEYIEVFYNRKRLHSSLGYVSPESFEAVA